MTAFLPILVNLLIRTVIASPFFVAGFLILVGADGSRLEAFAYGLFGCAGILTGAVIVAFPLARLAAESTGNLFWPGRRFDRPQPMYSIPQSRRVQGLYEEAMAGYEKIAADYPGEVQPYVEMVIIAIRDLKDPVRAEEILQKGLAIMTRDKDRETLLHVYHSISPDH